MSAPDKTDHTAMNASEDEVMSTPIPWDHDTAVSCIREAIEDLGGIKALHESEDVRLRSVLVRNYAHALKLDSDQYLLPSDITKARIAMQADVNPEHWEALVIIESMAMSGDMVKAERKVKRTIGDRPGKQKGRKRSTNEARNGFICGSVEFLTNPDGVACMKLKNATIAIAEAMYGVGNKREHEIGNAIRSVKKGLEGIEQLRKLAEHRAYTYRYERFIAESHPELHPDTSIPPALVRFASECQ